jgi:hypothetical protein
MRDRLAGQPPPTAQDMRPLRKPKETTHLTIYLISDDALFTSGQVFIIGESIFI